MLSKNSKSKLRIFRSQILIYFQPDTNNFPHSRAPARGMFSSGSKWSNGFLVPLRNGELRSIEHQKYCISYCSRLLISSQAFDYHNFFAWQVTCTTDWRRKHRYQARIWVKMMVQMRSYSLIKIGTYGRLDNFCQFCNFKSLTVGGRQQETKSNCCIWCSKEIASCIIQWFSYEEIQG